MSSSSSPTWADIARRIVRLAYARYRHSSVRKWWRRHWTTRGLVARLRARRLSTVVASSPPGTPIRVSQREMHELMKAMFHQRYIPPNLGQRIEELAWPPKRRTSPISADAIGPENVTSEAK